MSLKDRIAKVQSTSAVAGESIDQGLRSYMLKVYNFMASGVLLTGFVSLFLFKPIAWIDITFPRGLLFFLSIFQLYLPP